MFCAPQQPEPTAPSGTFAQESSRLLDQLRDWAIELQQRHKARGKQIMLRHAD